MASLKESTVAGVLAWGGVFLGIGTSLVLSARPGHAQPQPPPAGSAATSANPPAKGPLPPLPAGSASAAPAGSAAPGAAPPPYMYQEPWSPPEGQRAAPSGQQAALPLPVAAPAQYVYDPPPPAPPMHRSPYNALFVGARVGALFPFGNAYDTDPYYNEGEKWDWLATGGPLIEGDVGVRFVRNFIVYGFWEHAWMGQGSDPSWRAATGSNFGDQQSATTDYTGLGFRWSSRPSTIGFLVDLGLGYRWFHERWSSGAKMDLSGFGEFRVGLGADVRMNSLFSLTPLLSLSSGAFSDRTVTIPGKGKGDIAGTFSGSHGTVTLSVGGNFDLFGAM